MESRTTLKSYFQTGDKPTETQFASLIDSVPNLIDDSSEYTEIILKTDVTVGATSQDITILNSDINNYFLITECWFIVLNITGTSTDLTKDIKVGNQGSLHLAESSGYNSDVVGGSAYDLSTALSIHCDEYPTGITAMSIRVLCRGYKVSKT